MNADEFRRRLKEAQEAVERIGANLRDGESWEEIVEQIAREIGEDDETQR